MCHDLGASNFGTWKGSQGRQPLAKAIRRVWSDTGAPCVLTRLHHHCPSNRNTFQHGVEEGGQGPRGWNRTRQGVKTKKGDAERQSAQDGETRPVCTQAQGLPCLKLLKK